MGGVQAQFECHVAPDEGFLRNRTLSLGPASVTELLGSRRCIWRNSR